MSDEFSFDVCSVCRQPIWLSPDGDWLADDGWECPIGWSEGEAPPHKPEIVVLRAVLSQLIDATDPSVIGTHHRPGIAKARAAAVSVLKGPE